MGEKITVGYNKDLFNTTLKSYSQYIQDCTDINIRRKLKRLNNTFKEIVSTNDWKKYGFHGILHELKTHEFLSRFHSVISCDDSKIGPDYKQNGTAFECVSITFGAEGTEVYNKLSGERTGVGYDTLPRKDLIFRVTSAIDSKKQQYIKHLENGAINAADPYIMVVDMSLIYCQHSQLFNNFWEMLLPTMGVGEQYIRIDKSTLQTIDSDYVRYDLLQKPNKAEINMALFRREDFNFLSGILFTSAPLPDKYTSDNVIFMDNPWTKNKLNYGIYAGLKAWLYDFETEIYSVRNL
jgi:hypothetical protein